MPADTPTAAKKTPAKRPARKTAAARPAMDVTVAPTDRDVPLLGGPGAGMAHVLDVPVDDVAAHPDNVRHVVEDLEEMADSMRSLGVLERLLVAPTPSDAEGNLSGVTPYRVIAGHRRLAAARLAGLTHVPVEVRYDLDTTTKQVEAMLVENIHRKDLTPVEEGEAYQTLLDLGSLDEDGIAHATGRSLGTVRQRLRLAKAPAAAKQAVHSRTATLADVDLLYESDGDPAQVPALKALADGTDARRDIVQAAQVARKRREVLEQLRQAFDAGVTQTTLPEDWRSYSSKKPMALAWALTGNEYSKATPEQIVAHMACPGHAVVDRSDDLWNPEIVWVCTDPSQHKGARGTGLSDAEKAERAKTREQNRKNREAQDEFDVAAAVRRRHLRELVAGGGAPKAVEQLARLLAETTLLNTWSAQHEEQRARVRVYVDLLGITLTDDAAKRLDDKWMAPTLAAEEVVDVLDVLSDAAAVTAAAAAVLETHMAARWSPTSPHYLSDLSLEWLVTCREHLGYELTTYEDTLLKKATAAAAKKAAKK